MKYPACLLLLFLACTPSRAQNSPSIDLRVHNGRLELVCPEGLPPGAYLSVTTPAGSRAQSIPSSEGGGLALIPLDVTPAALVASYPRISQRPLPSTALISPRSGVSSHWLAFRSHSPPPPRPTVPLRGLWR